MKIISFMALFSTGPDRLGRGADLKARPLEASDAAVQALRDAASNDRTSAQYYVGAWTRPEERLAVEHPYPQKIMGVDDARLALYSAVAGGEVLICNHNATWVPPIRVNDDYCDCGEDGLDEPSTSACSGVLFPKVEVASPGFWCENGGRASAFIPMSRVGDGVCDCCDGSDEALSIARLFGEVNVAVCEDTCGTMRLQASLRLADMSRGLAKRRALEEQLDEEIEGQKARAQTMIKEATQTEGLASQLRYYVLKHEAVERGKWRNEIFTHWADGRHERVCVTPPLPLRDDTQPGSNSHEVYRGYGNHPNMPNFRAAHPSMPTWRANELEHQWNDARMERVRSGAECVPAERPARVMERGFSPHSPSKSRILAVKLVEGPMANMTLGMYLDRMKLMNKKPRDRQFVTLQQYRDRTTLFSWILNHRRGGNRAIQVGLHIVGIVLAPATLVLQPLFGILQGNAAVTALVGFFNTTVSEDEVAADLEGLNEDLDFLDAEVERAHTMVSFEWFFNWRRYRRVRAVVLFLRRILRHTAWARAVVWHTPRVLVEMLWPEASSAYRRNLLTHSPELALLRGGVHVAEIEADVLRGAHRRVIEDLNFYDSNSRAGSSNPSRLWFPFRSRCWEWQHGNGRTSFTFCPFREVTMDSFRSLGKFEGWGRDPHTGRQLPDIMMFGNGDATNCPQFKPRKCAVRMICTANYTILDVVEPSTCSFEMKFGSPLGCTEAVLVAEEARLASEADNDHGKLRSAWT